MSEVKDIVLPILQKIQADIASHRAKTDAISETLSAVQEKVVSIEGLMTWNLGLTSEHKHAIEEMQKRMRELEQRVTAIESRS